MHRTPRLQLVVALALAAVASACLLTACAVPNVAHYTLTVEGVNAATTPSGSLSVASGASTAISATPTTPWVWPGANGWTVVSGTASIATPSNQSTTVVLSSGDATIRATGGDPSGHFVLIVQGVNCTTTPSGASAVVASSPTSISAIADAGHSMPGSNVWSIVSGSASIADVNSASTSVTLSAGDATIQASCP